MPLLIMISSCLLFFCTQAAAENTPNLQRTLFQYQMFCQGCHTPDGLGGEGVPKIKNFIGNFLSIENGREYLVQVPGAAYSALSDSDLANVINWMILEFGEKSIPENFIPYSTAEVAELRSQPLFNVRGKRAQLIKNMIAKN